MIVTFPASVEVAEESSSEGHSSDSAEYLARAYAHGGDCVDYGLPDGASDFGWKPAEVVPLLRAEGDRVIAVVVNPVAGPDLMILAGSRRNVISFWLWEELPNGRFRGHKLG
jgi:hypothetical protein